jgi:lipoyl(octanoyl) transferase
MSMPPPPPRVHTLHLGRLGYLQAYERQQQMHEQHLTLRDQALRDYALRDQALPAQAGSPHTLILGTLLTVEHDPVITVSRRKDAPSHVLASPAMLQHAGVAVCETDRGGDVTYHGPGQLVVYPIVDLNLLNLGLHDYMRLLEQSVIDSLHHFGIESHRDPPATGVWVHTVDAAPPGNHAQPPVEPAAKIAAFGVRVRRWITMHGLSLNITTNLDHFKLIVPCGLTRPVTSMQQLLGARCPAWSEVSSVVLANLERLLIAQYNDAAQKRARAIQSPDDA